MGALREAVVKDLQNNEEAKRRSGYVGAERQRAYREGLNQLLEDKVWNVEMGDLALPGIAFTTRKIILAYNTNPNMTGMSPISVVRPEELGGTADTNIPLVVCYSGAHYEGLVPSTPWDVQQTVQLVNSYPDDVTVEHIPVLNALRHKVQFPSLEESVKLGQKKKLFYKERQSKNTSSLSS